MTIKLMCDNHPAGPLEIPDPALFCDPKVREVVGMILLIAFQGYEKCFALCQYTISLIIKEIHKVGHCRPDNIEMKSSSQIIQEMSPKPPVPQIVHLADPELHLPSLKSLKEQQVDLPFTSLPEIFIFHQRSELSVFALQPPQPADTDCQDSVNFPQNLKILNEFPDINFCHVDLLRNVNHQFCKNNNNKFEDLSIFCNSLTL